MKTSLIVIFAFFFFIISCGGMHKSKKKSPPPAPVKTEVAPAPVEIQKAEAPPIVEVKEKLVAVPDVPADPHEYFVIIGSFKNPGNAKNFQLQIAADGFTSSLLQNEAGLYRVSVKSTDDVTAARNEIRRIRSQYKKYSDTWLLIRIK